MPQSISVPIVTQKADLSNIRIRVLDIKPEDLAKTLIPFLSVGSKLYKVDIIDVKIKCAINDLDKLTKFAGYKAEDRIEEQIPEDERDDYAKPWELTFDNMLNHGTKFFDALFYLSMNAADQKEVLANAEIGTFTQANMSEICTALFFQYFFIITRGAISTSTGTKEGSDVPKFLSAVLKCPESPAYYADVLASFNLEKIDPAFAKYAGFAGLGSEAISRFGLGVAGYRAFAPFKYLTPVSTMTAVVKEAYEFTLNFMSMQYSWDLTSATRDPTLISKYGSINKNLANLSVFCFSFEDLTGLVQRKALYALPKFDQSQMNFIRWTGIPLVNPNSGMFTKDPVSVSGDNRYTGNIAEEHDSQCIFITNPEACGALGVNKGVAGGKRANGPGGGRPRPPPPPGTGGLGGAGPGDGQGGPGAPGNGGHDLPPDDDVDEDDDNESPGPSDENNQFDQITRDEATDGQITSAPQVGWQESPKSSLKSPAAKFSTPEPTGKVFDLKSQAVATGNQRESKKYTDPSTDPDLVRYPIDLTARKYHRQKLYISVEDGKYFPLHPADMRVDMKAISLSVKIDEDEKDLMRQEAMRLNWPAHISAGTTTVATKKTVAAKPQV